MEEWSFIAIVEVLFRQHIMMFFMSVPNILKQIVILYGLTYFVVLFDLFPLHRLIRRLMSLLRHIHLDVFESCFPNSDLPLLCHLEFEGGCQRYCQVHNLYSLILIYQDCYCNIQLLQIAFQNSLLIGSCICTKIYKNYTFHSIRFKGHPQKLDFLTNEQLYL